MSNRERLVNRTLNPLLAGLPDQFREYRPQQIEAVLEALAAFQRGASVVLLQAPTGSGKTLIAESVRLMLRARGVYMCSGKELQDQFARDFLYARVVKGRANYPTELRGPDFHPHRWLGHISADDCTWDAELPVCALCTHKTRCPYEVAKKAAIESPLAVLNSSYFLTEANGPGKFAGRDLVIADEADTLETTLMGWVSIEVTPRRMDRYGWSAPKLTVEEDWLRWCEEKYEEIKSMVRLLNPESETRELKYLRGLRQNLARIISDMKSGSSSWVYDGTRERVSFKPSRVVQYGGPNLWQHGSKWLLTSATIISADEMMFSLGGRSRTYESFSLSSSFPIANRKVIVRPVADMTRKREGKDDGKLLAAIRNISLQHPSDRILVHSVSYALTDKIARTLRGLFPRRPILSYRSAAERAVSLADYKATPGAILCGPSLDRGVDLPGDLCRVQLICKVPFPNLGDKVVNARYHSGQEGKTWYTVQTVRTIVQMTGRGVRNEHDHCVSYILDSAFGSRLWSSGGRGLFPEWWKEALVWERP